MAPWKHGESVHVATTPRPPTVSDTPTGPALDFARDQLAADTTPGDKFLLLVTDGQPDYCDNPTPKCAVDGVVRRLQELRTAGVRTLVFGFEGISSDNQDEIAGLTWALQSFANAGAGEPVGVQAGMTREQYGVELTPGAVVFWDECSGYDPWKTEHEAAAHGEVLPETWRMGAAVEIKLGRWMRGRKQISGELSPWRDEMLNAIAQWAYNQREKKQGSLSFDAAQRTLLA